MSGSSDLVRTVALRDYVRPAISSGKKQFSISVKQLMKDLRPIGFPAGNYPQICTSIQEKNFLKGNGIRVSGVDGPPSGQSSTVVVHYEVLGGQGPGLEQDGVEVSAHRQAETNEDPKARALRLMEGLRGLLKEELAEYGGGEAFIRWIRSEDDMPPQSPQKL